MAAPAPVILLGDGGFTSVPASAGDACRVFSALAGIPLETEVEPVGRSFARLALLRAHGHDAVEAGKGASEAADANARRARTESQERADIDMAIAAENHYMALGLGEDATDEEIKKSYRALLLKYHPDKQQSGGGGGSDSGSDSDEKDENPAFLAVQKAFETLSDPVKRRAYDSQFDFDDAIPTGNERFGSDQEFFDLYGPIFKRNAKFSSTKPVPAFGDGSTPIKDVQGFYDFWYSFDSWRDFSKFDEHKPEDADDRFEKRHLEKQNAAARAKRKKAEMKRLMNLVSRAHQNDMRIARWEKSERERKAREHQERAEAEAKAKADAIAKAAEDKKNAKEAKEARKQALKKARKRIRKLTLACRDSGVDVDLEDEEMDWLLVTLDLPGLEALGAAFEAEPSNFALVKAQYDAEKEREQYEKDVKAGKFRKATEDAAHKAGGKPKVAWTTDELSTLAKAIKKHPGGTHKRWDVIAEEVNALELGNERTAQECIAQNAQLQNRGAQGITDDSQAFNQFQKVLGKKVGTAPADPVEAARAAAAAAPSTGAGAGTPAAATETAAAKPAEAVWTPEEQVALEAALKKYPASMDKNERWRSIAEAVPGKTKKDCVVRYKQIVATLKAKKSAS